MFNFQREQAPGRVVIQGDASRDVEDRVEMQLLGGGRRDVRAAREASRSIENKGGDVIRYDEGAAFVFGVADTVDVKFVG